jgi:hypothetical protein
MSTGESGVKMMVVLMVLALGFLAREYLALRAEMESEQQAYHACAEAGRTLEAQVRGQTMRLQELETSARQWEPALKTLQEQNQALLLERQAALTAAQDIQAQHDLLAAQLAHTQARLQALQIERDQAVSEANGKNIAGETISYEPNFQVAGFERLSLSGVDLPLWLWLALAGAGLGGFAAARLVPAWLNPQRSLNVRLSRAEARWICRMRRERAKLEQ